MKKRKENTSTTASVTLQDYDQTLHIELAFNIAVIK